MILVGLQSERPNMLCQVKIRRVNKKQREREKERKERKKEKKERKMKQNQPPIMLCAMHNQTQCVQVLQRMGKIIGGPE